MAETNTQPNPQWQGIFQENANQDIINMDSQQSWQWQTPPQGADWQQVTDTVTPQWQWFFSQNANQDIINMDSQKESSQWMEQDVQQVLPLNEEEQQNFIQDLWQTLRDRLTKAQKDWQEVDWQLRDQIFSDIVSGMWGRLDINNPDVVRLRDRVYQNALLWFQKDRWEDVYSGMQNTFQRTQLLNQMDNFDIASALQSGTIKYRDIRGLQVFNPQKYQDVIRQYSELKRSNTSNVVAWDKEAKDYDTETMVPTAQEYGEQVSEEYDTPLEQIEAKWLLWVYDQMMGSATLQGEKDRLTEVNGQIAKLQNEKSKLYKKLENKITDKAILDAVYRDQVEDLNLELSTLLAEQSTLQASVDSQIQSAKDRFDIAMKEYEMEQDRQMEMLGLQKDFYNQQIQIMNAAISWEAKQHFLQQSVLTQASLFGMSPEYVEYQLAAIKNLDMSKSSGRKQSLDTKNGLHIAFNEDTWEIRVQNYHDWDNSEVWLNSVVDIYNNMPVSYGDYDANGNLLEWRDGSNFGVDFTLDRWTEIQSSYEWVIEDYRLDAYGRNNYVRIRTAVWDHTLQYNHLDYDKLKQLIDSWKIQKWWNIYVWDVIWYVGNTWNVYSSVLGKRLRKDGQVMPWQEEALSQWYGSHLDVMIRDSLWNPVLGSQAHKILKWSLIAEDNLSLLRNAFSSAYSWPTSQKDDSIAMIEEMIQQWDVSSVMTEIYDEVVAKMQTEEAKKFVSRRNIIPEMIRTNQLWADYEAKINSWEYTAWETDNAFLNTILENVDKTVWKKPDYMSDEQYQHALQLRSAFKYLLDDEVRRQTGAALTKDEQEFYEDLFPKSGLWRTRNEVKRDRILMEDLINRMVNQTNDTYKNNLNNDKAWDRLYGGTLFSDEFIAEEADFSFDD